MANDKTKLPPPSLGNEPDSVEEIKLGRPEDITAPIERAVVAKTVELGEHEADLYPVLTEAEIVEAKVRAREKHGADHRKKMISLIEAEEEARLLREMPDPIKGVEGEMVRITLDLAEHQPCIRINMFEEYFSGVTYKVPRHKARFLMEEQYRGHMHQMVDIEGKSRTKFYQRPRDTRVSASGTVNAPIAA